MDQEKKSLSSEEDSALENQNATGKVSSYNPSESIRVPDDAFADSEEPENEEPAELLPQSLADEEEPLDLADDPLFTDEEMADLTAKSAVTDLPPSVPTASIEAEAEDTGIEESENLPKSTENKEKRINGIFDILEMFVFALAFVLIAMAFCFRHSIVDGPSMMHTLQDGEHLIISSLFYTPKQGDIVVVQDLSKEDTSSLLTKPIVKRIIATEGQTVKIEQGRKVYVDGVLLEEPYIFIDEPFYDYEELELTVAEGEVFLMGDHRNNSADSRAAGAFREEAILGKVVLRFLPLQRFGAVK